jgi:hypothetical protein
MNARSAKPTRFKGGKQPCSLAASARSSLGIDHRQFDIGAVHRRAVEQVELLEDEAELPIAHVREPIAGFSVSRQATPSSR